MLKKKYILLFILIMSTVFMTLLLADLYKKNYLNESYIYKELNKITFNEFNEYMMENSDVIIYISDKNNSNNISFEKQLVKKLKKTNLLKNTIYIEKMDVKDNVIKALNELYGYKYEEENIPIIIVINNGEKIQTIKINNNTNINEINFEVFK